MNRLTLLGLVFLAAAVLTAAVGAATATAGSVLCTAQESPCQEANRLATGTTLDFSLKAGTSALLADTAGAELEKCTGGTVKGKIEKAEEVTGSIESLSWSGCTFPTTVAKSSKLEILNIAGTHNGTVKADAEIGITINGGFFGSCNYAVTTGTDIGELKEGNPATLVANAVAEKLGGSAAACPETAKWTAEYTLSEPGGTISVESGTKATSGSVLCTTQESPCKEANRLGVGTTLDLSLESATSANLIDTEGETLDKCSSSTLKWKIDKAVAVTGSIEQLTWSSCTFPTAAITLGKLEIESKGAHNGTVKVDAEIGMMTSNTVFFGSCIYGVTAGVDFGELKEGNPATLFVNTVAEKLSGSNLACPATAKVTANYKVTEPSGKTLAVETT